MAISKIVYKSSPSATPVTWMDVTQKTVTSGTMLNGTTALKNDGTDITGNIASKTSSNLSASGATVTAEAGYYASSASKTVASGTEGTPTATKGTVSNHSVTVTPSVTNTAGYISGGTKTGTAVSVSASELVSGTYTVSASGTADVTNYASISVPAMTLPSASSSTSSGTSKATITPTSSAQYLNIPTGFNPTAQFYTIAASGGGGGASYSSGSITPSSNSLTETFDIEDSSYTHFMIWSETSPYGNGVRVSCLGLADFSTPMQMLINSNSSGASASGAIQWSSLMCFSKSGSTVTISSSGSNANHFNYFISGITYNWIAW